MDTSSLMMMRMNIRLLLTKSSHLMMVANAHRSMARRTKTASWTWARPTSLHRHAARLWRTYNTSMKGSCLTSFPRDFNVLSAPRSTTSAWQAQASSPRKMALNLLPSGAARATVLTLAVRVTCQAVATPPRSRPLLICRDIRASSPGAPCRRITTQLSATANVFTRHLSCVTLRRKHVHAEASALPSQAHQRQTKGRVLLSTCCP
mmetsp:Transcript_42162/g.92423  ORF Transcript_42162/g.92423 Transcript_42162/m.92423 type:complete len:206 (+) Transcript_42162:146-763(+)